MSDAPSPPPLSPRDPVPRRPSASRASPSRLVVQSIGGVPVRGIPVPLRTGDVLLYRGTGVFSTLIRLKTWSDVTHVEVAGFDPTTAYAARDGQGVGTYDIRRDDLYAVLRPRWRVNVRALRGFHERCCHPPQGYDWWGLLRFFTFGQPSLDKQFCSEYATRLLRASGGDPFARDYDADRVAPGWFLACPSSVMTTTWRVHGLSGG